VDNDWDPRVPHEDRIFSVNLERMSPPLHHWPLPIQFVVERILSDVVKIVTIQSCCSHLEKTNTSVRVIAKRISCEIAVLGMTADDVERDCLKLTV
jgi:hypothetical protein